jgi:pimeloyl-ACP methyl ester carboxylesterase
MRKLLSQKNRKVLVILLTSLLTEPVVTLRSAPHVKTGYAPVNGLKMYYEIHGPVDGKKNPLVLVHGGGSTIETSFEKVLPALAKTRQVIAFEQQGHGHTADIIDRPFTFEQTADDTAGLMQHLKIEKADFFGYSNGGNVAMQVAIRHPNLVHKLIVASAMYKREGLYPEFWESMKHATLQNMPAELRKAYLSVAPNPENLPMFHDKSVKRMLEFRDWKPEDIQAIDAPTMVIIGDTDIVRPEHAVDMYRLLPHARLAVLPGTDHMELVERGDWLVSMIENFLDAPLLNQ